jgi:outer membrane protein
MRSFLHAAYASVAALLLVTAAPQLAKAQQTPASFRIAFVNTGALIESAPGRAEAESAFAKETDTYRDQLKKMSDSLNAMIAAFQKQEATLTAAQKETRTKSIRTLEEQFQGRTQQLQQQASARQNELMAPIMESVKKVLDDIRTEDGYAMIIAGDPNLILSYDKNLDITDRVVARLKSVASNKTPATRPAAPVGAPAGVTRKPPNQ